MALPQERLRVSGELTGGFPYRYTPSMPTQTLRCDGARASRRESTVPKVCFLAVLLLMVVGAKLGPATPVAAAELRVGTAAVNIDPPMGIPLAGYYNERGCEGVADDLFAKAAVWDDGQTRVAFVVCDLIGVPRPVVVEARRLIQERTGIPGANVMVSATHSHTGPVLISEFSGEADVIPTLVRTYTQGLPKLIAQTVADAQARLAPTRASYARAHEDRLSFNRRFFMKDGTVGWNPGKLNPEIIRPAGPIDPEVGVVYFETPDKQPQLTCVNFAMHPDTTGGTRVSADYMGALARCLTAHKGTAMLTLFANGTCGNLNHVNVRWADPQHGTNEANRLGAILAAAVFKAYMDLAPLADTTLRVRSRTVPLPLAAVTDADVRAALEIQKQGTKAKFMDQVQAQKVLDVDRRHGQPLEAEVQVITLGADLAWVSLPGEVFVEHGLNIKAASPFRQTQVVELANGEIDYVPNRAAFAEGNYEVVSARTGPGSGEMLVTAALQLLQELKTPAK